MAKSKRAGSVIELFDSIQKVIGKNPQSDEITALFARLGKLSLTYLQETQVQELRTHIPGRTYFSFLDDTGKSSRAVNRELFGDEQVIDGFTSAVGAGSLAASATSVEITRACYTLTMALACVVDLINPGDKQTPGTYFQYLITHLLCRHLQAQPSERVRVKVGEEDISLTIDLLFNLADHRPKLHVAIKNSTRERGSEFWAHQRILDQAFQEGSYLGVFVGLAETKLDHRTLTVTEICVPDQWRAYQAYIAKITRIYYVDPPAAYLKLNDQPPYIAVSPFGDYFFDERLF